MSIAAPRKLKKSYIWSKKIRIAVYKIITTFQELSLEIIEEKLMKNKQKIPQYS